MFRIKDIHIKGNTIYDGDQERSETWLMLRCMNRDTDMLSDKVHQFIVHATDDQWYKFPL